MKLGSSGGNPPPRSKRLQRPFQCSPRKPTRAELLVLLKRLYGPGIPRYSGSPYQATSLDDAELVLHELAHATQIPGELPIRSGRMKPSWDRMQEYLGTRKWVSREEADDHEVRAIAITMGVARTLRLPLYRPLLIAAGTKNSELHRDQKRFDQLVTEAEKTPTVRTGMQQVLDILDRAWTRKRSWV